MGLTVFVVAVVAKVPVHVSVTVAGAVPVVAQSAHAFEPCSNTAMKIASAAIAGAAIERLRLKSLGILFAT